MMLLHAGEALEPHDLATAWSFEPVVVTAMATAAFLYYRGTSLMLSRTTRSAPGIRRSRLLFTLGLLALVTALVSPLHELGGVLFSAHMSQHELLMTVAAPLLVLGQPGAPFAWALPLRARRRFAAIATRKWMRGFWGLVSSAPGAWILHGAAIWIWHVPRLYDASVGSELVHSLQHYSFVATALLFWWSMFRAARGHRAGVAILCLFTTALHTGLLGALLSSIDAPIYLAYDSTLNWGITPLEDQQLGGVIMWVPGGIPYLIAALLLFARWLTHAAGPRGTKQLSRIATLILIALAGCSDNSGSVADLTGVIRSEGASRCGSTGARHVTRYRELRVPEAWWARHSMVSRSDR
jgi:putative membrane protein